MRSTSVEFDPDLVARYDQRGPRYTSYPTAASFNALSQSDYQVAIAMSNGDPVPRPLSLYLHLPFCQTVCYYCACNRIITANRTRIDAYLGHLHTEIALQAALFDHDRVTEQIAWGGGTPNLLTLDETEALMAAIRSHFSLAPDDTGDYSIELDPRESDPGDLARLREIGFNRLSFGVQDFDPQVQRSVNRVQDEHHILSLIEAGRAARFHSINLDLIYGLPHQTAQSFSRTVARVVAAHPDRVSVFNYAHLPNQFKVQRQIDPSALPSPSVKLRILDQTIDQLTAAGYEYIGMDHFAHRGDSLSRARRARTMTRNFQGYSTHAGCDLIGLGVSAIGMVGDVYAQNERNITAYQTKISAGRLAIARGIVLSDDDIVRRDVIENLMCYAELDTTGIAQRWNIDFAVYFDEEIRALEPLIDDGLATWEGACLRITPRGRLLVRHLAMIFDRHISTGVTTPAFSRLI